MKLNNNKVNHPTHYNQGNIECIDAMVSAFGEREVAIWSKINAFKYIWRMGKKDDYLTDLRKAKWYLSKAEELFGELEKGHAVDTPPKSLPITDPFEGNHSITFQGEPITSIFADN